MFKKVLSSLSILEIKEKRNFFLLFLLMTIAFILETVSIGTIIPLLIFLSEPSDNKIFIYIENITFFKNLSNIEKIQFFIGVFLFFFVLKNIFLIFFRWFQINFTTNLTINLSKKLFRKYLAQPYLFFVKQKSAKLIRNVMVETTRFSSNVETYANLILETLVLTTLSMFLFLYDPKSFIFVTTVALVVFFAFSLFTKSKLTKWAKERVIYEAKVINKLQTGFNLSKIIKIFFKNKKFDDEYHVNIKKLQYAIRNRGILNRLPKHIFEIVAVISLSSLILFFTKSGKEFGDVIILLGLFAAAMYRIFPAIVNIITSLQVLQFNIPSIDILTKELKRPDFKKIKKTKFKKELSFKKDISLEKISFKYPQSKKRILNKLKFNVKKNQIIGIAGSSGSGKTTLIDILLGVLTPEKGSLKVDGKNLKQNQIYNWGKMIGYVPQGVFLLDDTIEKNIAFGLKENEIDLKRVIESAKNAQIHNFVMSLKKRYQTILSEKGSNFSEGQKQRIAIARALYKEPKILILDEATSALDTKTEEKFIKTLRSFKNKKTIILIAHRYSVLRFCEKVYLFDLNKNFRVVGKKYIKQIT